MKTKILVLAVLLFGGLLFTSCQKDNALMEDNTLVTYDLKDQQFPFELQNYPNPFKTFTKIGYKIPCCANVTLKVYPEGLSHLNDVIVLISGRQEIGTHSVEFDASGLPDGKYIADLRVEGRLSRIVMTKSRFIDFDHNDLR